MALNGDKLGELIATSLKTIFIKDIDTKQMDNVCKAIGNAIITHIKTSAEVSTTVTGSCTTPVGEGTIKGSGTGGIK